jgi:diguanylate cyclase (GGDEF)-like protein
MLMDLDHFKKINDSYGHAAGDRLLCAFADCAHEVVRPTDLLARYGGEEFSMLLPDTDLVQAERIAERLRARFAGVRIEMDAERVGTTVSIGVTQIQLDRETVERALARADVALYRAKEQGRDRVLSCTE